MIFQCFSATISKTALKEMGAVAVLICLLPSMLLPDPTVLCMCIGGEKRQAFLLFFPNGKNNKKANQIFPLGKIKRILL